jgi:hypothetical protein
MDIGMLWFDDDGKRSLNEKVMRAVTHYKTKYGVTPTVCFVNPGMLGKDAPEVAAGVQIRPARTVMQHHFWLGVGETAAREAGNHASRGNGARRNGGSKARSSKKERN